MSSLYGTTQAYQAISDTYLALSLGCDDKIFGTDIPYCNLVDWGIYDGQERDPYVLNMYQKQHKKQSDFCTDPLCKKQYESLDLSSSTTVWNIMQSLPECSKFTSICYRSGWNQYLNQSNPLSKVTIFVPINQSIPDDWLERMKSLNGNTVRPFCKSHTLPFALEIEQTKKRKLRCYTCLDSFSIFIDGTEEVEPGVTIYEPKDTFNTLTYPTPLRRIHILKTIYTQNGTIMLIDGIFKPKVLV